MGHDAILQIRSDREIEQNEIRSIHNIIERYCGSVDYEFIDSDSGIDVYIAGLVNARHAAARIMKVLGGSKKESTKYLRVENGRAVYRFTIRVKLPDEASKAKYGFED